MPTWEAVPPCSSPDVDALLGCAPTAADMKTALEHDPTNRAVARHVETLQKAVDAYRQARTLDSQLKRSERAVERQTQQLRKELKQTKVAAASANTHAFRQEVRLRLLDQGSVSVCSRPCLRLAGLREIAPVRTRV